MLGYAPNEIEPSLSGWHDRIHPDDLFATVELWEKHLRGETEIYEAVYRKKTKDGNWRWVLDHGMVVQRDANKRPLRIIGTNIGKVSVSAFHKGKQIEIGVTDNGVGMEKEFADNLFKSNLFKSNYGTNNEKGSGLGLVQGF